MTSHTLGSRRATGIPLGCVIALIFLHHSVSYISLPTFPPSLELLPMAITISFIIAQLKMMLLLFLALLSLIARAQQTLFPPAIPLAVRSPYLSSWDDITDGTTFGQLWPRTPNSYQVARHLCSVGHESLIFICFRSSDGLFSYVSMA